MGFFDKLFGPPSKDKFAKLIIARLRKAGVTGELIYNAEGFWLRQPDRGQFNLSNAYADYCRSNKEDRERSIKAYLFAWASAGKELKSSFGGVLYRRNDSGMLGVPRRRVYDTVLLREQTGG